uniref:Uncharacterized protein n=1 Tax=Anguilla anguilla TaxID=7936 RepID=A0A0E9UF44_ANGAN
MWLKLSNNSKHLSSSLVFRDTKCANESGVWAHATLKGRSVQ